jgi:hypothetical protein
MVSMTAGRRCRLVGALLAEATGRPSDHTWQQWLVVLASASASALNRKDEKDLVEVLQEEAMGKPSDHTWQQWLVVLASALASVLNRKEEDHLAEVLQEEAVGKPPSGHHVHVHVCRLWWDHGQKAIDDAAPKLL